MTHAPRDRQNEDYWREYLEEPDSLMRFGRRVFSLIPTDPRCQLCAAPFKGVGGSAMRIIGKRPSDGNPNMCNSCQTHMIKYHGGAEITATMLFADIRGSTTIADATTSTEFRALLDRFYTEASASIFGHAGILEKFVGDEVVAAFPPLLGLDYTRRAIETARDILERTGHTDPAGPWAPIGAGIHTGRAWFGAVGEGSHTELATVGDAVNVTARLAALAQTGEIIVSAAAAAGAGLDPALPQRSLELKGKQEAIDVVSLKVEPATG